MRQKTEHGQNLHRGSRIMLAVLLIVAALCVAGIVRAQGLSSDKDYLTPEEADQIRDAVAPQKKIHLLLTFADDRLTKFETELSRATTQNRRGEILNGLLNAYVGCVDDAADFLDLEQEKQADTRLISKEAQDTLKGYLTRLQSVQKNGREIDLYKDTLDDAIDGTQDALKDATQAQQHGAPPPVRRKPQ